jgi:hypothetical protein
MAGGGDPVMNPGTRLVASTDTGQAARAAASAADRSPGGNGSHDHGLGDVLAVAAAAAHDRLVATPVGRNGSTAGDGWVGVDEMLADPTRLDLLLEHSGRRFGSDDRMLLSAQVARGAVSALVTTGVQLWATDRRLLDMSAANVALREDELATQVGLRSPRLAVLPGDCLAGRPGVEVLDDDAMFDRLLHQVVGYPVPSGELPAGPPDRSAAVAAIVATVRRAVRCGDRHFWGTAGLAAGSALTAASHRHGTRADGDRDRLFAARPDLARTVELVTIDDTLGGEITFPLRRTCCLLYKLPDKLQCGTCSLRDHDTCVGWTGDYHREERRQHRVL